MLFQDFGENEKLSNFFSILSTNVAENGAEFVSTIEGQLIILCELIKQSFHPNQYCHYAAFFFPGKKFPFYGVQWHPEVNRFQWNPKMNFPHSQHAVQLSSLLAEFFINEGTSFPYSWKN